MLEINVNFDSSVTNLETANPTLYNEFTTGVDDAVQALESLFSNPITVTIDVGYGEIDGQSLESDALGESEGEEVTASYSAVTSALIAENAPGSSTLPTTSPDQGTLLLNTAQAKALGLEANNNSLDGYVGFSSSSAFSYANGVTPPSSEYYFIGVVEHEMTEVMGRISLVNEQPNDYSVMDLYRYSSSGVRDLTAGRGNSTAYFSINNGATNLGTWNNVASNGDLGDWYPSGPAPDGDDAFNDYSDPGVINEISPNDVTLMEAIGFAGATPAAQTVTVSSVMVQPSSGDYTVGATLAIALEMSAAVTVSGVTPTLSLNDGGTAIYNPSASTGASLVFDYTVAAGQNTAALAVTGLNPNGATITGANGGTVNVSGAAATLNGLEIDTTPPSVTADSTLQAQQNATTVLTASVLDFSDNISSAAQVTYTIVTAPQNGTLLLNGSPTSSFTQAQIDNGDVSYDQTGRFVTSDAFSFTVSDAAGNTTPLEQFQIVIPSPPGTFTGVPEILWFNSTTGDVGYDNGADTTWHDLGVVPPGYTVASVGDFSGENTSDILWFNATTGDVGYNDGPNTTWHDLGAVPPGYAVAGVGDFSGGSTSDILWFNAATGDVGYNDGPNTTWHDLGFVPPGYTVAGVGDFSGNGATDILWFDPSTGDVGYNDGPNTTWHDLHSVPQGFTVAGVGDFNNDGTTDILWYNAASGNIGYNDGPWTPWHDLGFAATSYHVASA